MARQLSDGKLTLRFVKAHQHFEVRLQTEAVEAELHFHAHFPTFDFSACATAVPEKMCIRDSSGTGEKSHTRGRAGGGEAGGGDAAGTNRAGMGRDQAHHGARGAA